MEIREKPFYAEFEHYHVHEVLVPANVTSLILSNLSSYTLYQIDVMGVTAKGSGPRTAVLAGMVYFENEQMCSSLHL